RQTKNLCEAILCYTSLCIPLPHRANRSFVDLGLVVCRACAYGRPARPALFHGVLDVVLLCSGPQVFWITAATVVTGVHDHRRPVPVNGSKHGTVRSHDPSGSVLGAPYPTLSIAVPGHAP